MSECRWTIYFRKKIMHFQLFWGLLQSVTVREVHFGRRNGKVGEWECPEFYGMCAVLHPLNDCCLCLDLRCVQIRRVHVGEWCVERDQSSWQSASWRCCNFAVWSSCSLRSCPASSSVCGRSSSELFRLDGCHFSRLSIALFSWFNVQTTFCSMIVCSKWQKQKQTLV